MDDLGQAEALLERHLLAADVVEHCGRCLLELGEREPEEREQAGGVSAIVHPSRYTGKAARVPCRLGASLGATRLRARVSAPGAFRISEEV
jgi:hypothetical protein